MEAHESPIFNSNKKKWKCYFKHEEYSLYG